MNGKTGFLHEEISNVKGAGSNIANYGGNGSAGYPPAKDKNHNRIQDNIGDRTNQVSDHGFLGGALTPQNIAECSAEHDKWTAKCNVGQIFSGIVYGIFTGTDHL